MCALVQIFGIIEGFANGSKPVPFFLDQTAEEFDMKIREHSPLLGSGDNNFYRVTGSSKLLCPLNIPERTPAAVTAHGLQRSALYIMPLEVK
jgi:hypothetical protein